jgi:hypothetical protein
MLRLPLAAVVLAVAFSPALANDADIGPARLSPLQIGQIFCIARTGNDMAPIEAITTPALRQAIARADARESSWAKRNPGEKPPLGDGLPWQGSQDYTSDCTADHASANGPSASVAINYAFAGDPSGNYADLLMLRQVQNVDGNVWRIDNIQFADKTTMRQQMIDAFKP